MIEKTENIKHWHSLYWVAWYYLIDALEFTKEEKVNLMRKNLKKSKILFNQNSISIDELLTIEKIIENVEIKE